MGIFLILCIFGFNLFSETCFSEKQRCDLEGGALFEYGRCSGESTRDSEKASAENFNLLGQHDKNAEGFKKRSAKVRGQYQQRLRVWISGARNLMAQNQIPAVQLLSSIQSAIQNGNSLLQATSMGEIAGEKAELHKHFNKTENQIKAVIGERNESLQGANELSATIKKALTDKQDNLHELSQNSALLDLRLISVGQRRYQESQRRQQLLVREAAIARIQHQIKNLDVTSPWYEDEIEDLKWQLSLLEKSL